jgi:hypothetical protein
MVDALRHAHRLVRPDGCVVDLHPTAAIASVEVGAYATGSVDAGDAPLRHTAAGAALASVLDAGLFVVDGVLDFTFYTYGLTIEDLRHYIEENWRNARIDDDVVQRTRDALHDAPGIRPRVREQVRLTRLRPLALAESPNAIEASPLRGR